MSLHSPCERSWPYLEMTGGLGVALKPADGHSLQVRGLFLRVSPKTYCPDHLAWPSRVTVYQQRCAHSGDCGAVMNIKLDQCLEVTKTRSGGYFDGATVWFLGVRETKAN